jgi:hypothetical protein
MKKTFTHQPVIPEGYTGTDYNDWAKYVDSVVHPKPKKKKLRLVSQLSLVILIMFCLQACNGHICAGRDCDVYKDHDTGTYYRYRAINLKTGRIELAKVDTAWNVYQPTDTVYLDKDGFISQTKGKIVDTVQLGICVGTVTLVDDTIVLSSTQFIDKGDCAEIRLDVPPPKLGTAD